MSRPSKPPPALFSHPEVATFIASHPHHVGHLKRFCAAAELATWDQLLSLDRQQGAKARDAMRSSFSGPTVYHAVSAARALLRHLADRGVVATNVLDSVRTAGSVSPIPIFNVLQPGQDEKLLAAVKGSHAARDLAVLAVLLDHGLRATELAMLTWDRLYQEPDGRWTMTFIGKGGKPARMRVKPRTMDLVLKLGGSRTGPFIPKVPGVALTRQDIWSIVRRWAKVIGSPVTPHGLRATFISGVLARTGDLRKAQKMARHGSLLSTERYLRHEVLDDD
ncbi:MAG: tyrosine-type recombinase/integrase [Elusimicrobiota bacterium]|jgi:integrase/recombinase XerD